MWAHSPPREEGWTRHQENGAKPPFMERPGWSFTNHVAECVLEPWLDRKSTRLNSSHLVISYAVFCLKKKNKRSSLTAGGLAVSRPCPSFSESCLQITPVAFVCATVRVSCGGLCVGVCDITCPHLT